MRESTKSNNGKLRRIKGRETWRLLLAGKKHEQKCVEIQNFIRLFPHTRCCGCDAVPQAYKQIAWIAYIAFDSFFFVGRVSTGLANIFLLASTCVPFLTDTKTFWNGHNSHLFWANIFFFHSASCKYHVLMNNWRCIQKLLSVENNMNTSNQSYFTHFGNTTIHFNIMNHV